MFHKINVVEMEYCLYCDETCHIESDGINVMALGAVWCPKKEKDRIFDELRAIKVKHGFAPYWELKWNAVSGKKLDFYMEVVEYFFNEPDLHFRSVVVPDKSVLDHGAFHQTHDSFYYKLYFDLLKVLFRSENSYEIYLDIKDTRGQKKIMALHSYLCNNAHDFNQDVICKVQQVRSHEVELVQLADFLLGAVGYANRGLKTSEAKVALLRRIQGQHKYVLDKTSFYEESKMNILIWKSSKLC